MLRRWMFDVRCSMFSLLLLGCSPAFAQEDAELPPPPKRPGVQITFIPPPLNGTLSLGVFNKGGKLVRTLHREARTKEFVVGLNGLITWWDGKDDAGAVAPVGKYFARGFAVGAVEFQGEAFHFNEWIADEKSPRIRRIHSIGSYAGEPNEMYVTLSDGRSGTVDVFKDGKIDSFVERPPTDVLAKERAAAEAEGVLNYFTIDKQPYGLREGQVVRRGSEGWEKVELSPVENAIRLKASFTANGMSLWVIDRVSAGREIKQFGIDGTFMRRLAISPEEPQPYSLSTDLYDSMLILIEEAPGIQRVRTLERRSAKTPDEVKPDTNKTSEWAVTMSKTIRASETLVDVQSELKTEAGEPFAAVEKINVRLLPNQLMRNASTSVDVAVGVDAKGSFLRTADGLPLKRITETPGLRWAAMMREPEGKAVTIFQSDGAVVEEFKARKLASMMAFDAGDYDWAGK